VSRRYRILRCAGAGSFGRVYEAEMTGGVARRVALKVHQEAADLPEWSLARFRDEARMLAHLRHPVIVPMLDLVQLPMGWTMVLEWIDGVDLLELVRAGPQPPRVVASVIADVAQALHAAWEAPTGSGAPLHLIHRDLKPQNLRVTPNGHVHLLDLGAARGVFAAREAKTEGLVIGTFAYMAPERIGRSEDSPKVDVYSLGLVALDLLRGEPRPDLPISPRGRDGLLRRLGQELAEVAPDLGSEGHAAVHALIDAMCAWEPHDRPDMETVAARAAALVDSLPGPRPRAWLAEAVRRAPPPPERGDPWVGKEVAELGAAEPDLRGRWLAAVVVAALASIGSAAALWATSPDLPHPEEGVPAGIAAPPEIPDVRSPPEVRAEPADPPPTPTRPAGGPPPAVASRARPEPRVEPPAREAPAEPPAGPPPDAYVTVAGAAEVSALKDGRSVPLPGTLSPGTWTLFIGPSQASPVLTVEAGDQITLDCDRRFARCKRR
jgi:hypothetical protein